MHKCREGEGQAEPAASIAPDTGLDLRSSRSPPEPEIPTGAKLRPGRCPGRVAQAPASVRFVESFVPTSAPPCSLPSL